MVLSFSGFQQAQTEIVPTISSIAPSTIRITLEPQVDVHINEDAPNSYTINGQKIDLKTEQTEILLEDVTSDVVVEFNFYVCQGEACVPKKKTVTFVAAEDGATAVDYVYKLSL